MSKLRAVSRLYALFARAVRRCCVWIKTHEF